MRTTATHHQARRHPVAAFLTLLIFGPFLLAALLLTLVVYLIVTILTLGRGT